MIDWARVARDAFQGDRDAVFELARHAPCRDFEEFVRRFAPTDLDVRTFDAFADGYWRMRDENALDRQLRDCKVPDDLEEKLA